jgi:putative heme-binding domain-containing protein
MYRAVIEHPHWMPVELRQRPDLLYGNDRGRIYRVVAQDFGRPQPPRLSASPNRALVALLADPNAWRRETAARLLLERQDKSVAPQLKEIVLHDHLAAARIQALRLLEAFKVLDEGLLEHLLDDLNPRIVEQAIAAAESLSPLSGRLRDHIAQLVRHTDARVRFQAYFTALPLASPPAYPTDRWELDAMLIAAGERGGNVLARMLDKPEALAANVTEPKRFIASLAQLAAAAGESQWKAAIDALSASHEYERIGLTALLEGLRRRGSFDTIRPDLRQALAQARADAADGSLPEADRCEAIGLLGVADEETTALAAIARDDPSEAIRYCAVAALAQSHKIEPWRELLSRFSNEPPALQRAILDGALASSERIALFFDEVAAGRIKPTVLDVARSKRLLEHPDAQVKQQAERLLADAVPKDREQALLDYRGALKLHADASRGRGVFERNCANCHRIGDVGVQVAPDIADSREKTPEQLLTDIIQPNRAIDSNYFSYTAITSDGLVHTGVLAAETSTSVTIKQAEGKTITLSRDQIEELRCDGVSFMPDGLEKNISPQ